MEANFEILLQQSNEIRQFIEEQVATLDKSSLVSKPDEKTWSVLEVIDHLNLVYDKYLDNAWRAVENAKDLSDGHIMKRKTTILGSLSVYSQRPKGQKRKFKMKTFDFFEPGVHLEEIDKTLNQYFKNKSRFNEILRKARLKDLERVKIPTSLGENVQFYFYQCMEFLIAHEQRHVVQLKSLISAV